ncbi:hypothetical protein [Streptomyces sp. NPDC057623]|uniref:hypothetical protein n=1 Tax=Streptomyces sp. NPDC057623 TaxID=3346187 RepID=UPI0036749B52
MLGIPATLGHGPFITGNLIYSLGNGMLLPLGLLYFTTLRDLPLAAVGAAVTVGQLVALPVAFVADRSWTGTGPGTSPSSPTWSAPRAFSPSSSPTGPGRSPTPTFWCGPASTPTTRRSAR